MPQRSSCFRSVPQIVKIFQSGGSTEGLSLTANVMVGTLPAPWHQFPPTLPYMQELLCFAVNVAYNIGHGYALNTYAEVRQGLSQARGSSVLPFLTPVWRVLHAVGEQVL